MNATSSTLYPQLADARRAEAETGAAHAAAVANRERLEKEAAKTPSVGRQMAETAVTEGGTNLDGDTIFRFTFCGRYAALFTRENDSYRENRRNAVVNVIADMIDTAAALAASPAAAPPPVGAEGLMETPETVAERMVPDRVGIEVEIGWQGGRVAFRRPIGHFESLVRELIKAMIRERDAAHAANAQRKVDEAVVTEREECAELAESLFAGRQASPGCTITQYWKNVAGAIRARKDQR